MSLPTKPILVTGATGYIGGRLVPQLLQAGYRVRAASRSISKLKSRPWAQHTSVELVELNALDLQSFNQSAEGCFAAYYLVHSMLPGQSNFEEADRNAAQNMVAAAEFRNLDRIIYLGGLGEDTPDLSKHLQSRAEVGKILSSGKVPVTTLRAAMIIGSGSASFEILRYLVDRLPVMITPKWLQTKSQPIAVRNVIEYLVGTLKHDEMKGKVYDIGGKDILTYHDLMKIYAEEAGLPKRWVIPVPVLTPRLSSYWIHLVTPVSSAIARPLAEGLKNPVVCQENKIRELIPEEVLGCREAIRFALERLRGDQVISHWTDAGSLPPVESVYKGDPKWAGGTRFRDHKECVVPCAPERVWKVICAIGGKNGWYYANWLWVLRGFLDHLFGGVGLRRGRRDGDEILPGDALDFWRVLHVEPGKELVLLAEMKLPGTATLTFRVTPAEGNATRLEQIAEYVPKGLLGILYWYSVAPFHHFIFNGMMSRIGELALLTPTPSKL